MSALAILALAAAAAEPAAGQVKLPLRDYLALVESVESAQRARGATESRTEPSVAELISQKTSVVFGEDNAEVTSVYETDFRGPSPRPLPLPLTGIAWRVALEPAGPAAVRKSERGLEIVSPDAGRYRVTVQSQAAFDPQATGAQHVTLAAMSAPVSQAEVSLPAAHSWSCQGCVVVEDVTHDGRRVVRLALPRGEAVGFEARKTVKVIETAVASADVVTIVSLGVDGPRRHDVVLYEVSRGELGTMTVTLPQGLDPLRAATDEGEAPPALDGRELRIERAKKLTSGGYLALTSPLPDGPSMALPPVLPGVRVRARYLVLSLAVASNVQPLPQAAWIPVDLSDVPASIPDALKESGLVAAWRLRGEEQALSLSVSRLPAPAQLETEILHRDSLTLLTVDGTLLHRDRFTLAQSGAALVLKLPPDGTVWSCEVNGVAVRPIEGEGRVRIPLGLASAAGTLAQVVVVVPKVLPPGKSQLALALPEVDAPVLQHEWRLMLPAGNRYRYAGGDLRPVPPAATPVSITEPRAGVTIGTEPGQAQSVARGPGGRAEVRGRVTDRSGGTLPGAIVTLRATSTGQELKVVADALGLFFFKQLPAGDYTLRGQLLGFNDVDYRIHLQPLDTPAYALTLDIGTVTETVTVSAEPLNGRDYQRLALLADKKEAEAKQQAAEEEQRRQLSEMQRGLASGVKPVPVTIPEQGKLLVLAGALPPSRVGLTLDVKARKR